MIKFKSFIPGIAWFFVVLVLLCLPGDDLPKAAGWMEKIMFDKWVHIGLFSTLAFLFMWPFRLAAFSNKQRTFLFLRIAFAVSIWGLTSEFIQKFYIPGRSFDLLDWAADSFGATLAFVFALKFLPHKKTATVGGGF